MKKGQEIRCTECNEKIAEVRAGVIGPCIHGACAACSAKLRGERDRLREQLKSSIETREELRRSRDDLQRELDRRTGERDSVAERHSATLRDLDLHSKELADTRARLQDRERQLAEVRKWMAENGEGYDRPLVKELSRRLLWCDKGPDGRPAPDPLTAERVEALEQAPAQLSKRAWAKIKRINEQGASVRNDSQERLTILEDSLSRHRGEVTAGMNRQVKTNDSVECRLHKLEELAERVTNHIPELHPDEGKYDDGRG